MNTDNIRFALEEIYDEEINELENLQKLFAPHLFSYGFSRKFEKARKMSRRRYVEISKIRLRRAVAFAIIVSILFISTVGVMALVSPKFRMIIEKGKKEWMLEFVNESKDCEEISLPFEYIKPDMPDGFRIVKEEKMEAMYNITYKNDKGIEIFYYQIKLDGLRAYIDAEHGIHNININGDKGLGFDNDGEGSITWNHGLYNFNLDGNCSEGYLIEIAKNMYKQKNMKN